MLSLYGLIGQKLSHSFSPKLHGIIFEKLGIRGQYDLFEVEPHNLSSIMNHLKTLSCKGVNVTIPYKIDIMGYIDEISPEARAIGAVNTISFLEEGTIGYNTDYHGFGMLLNHNSIEVNKNKFVVLGSGGVAKSVAQYLVDNNARDIVIISRNPEKERNKFKDIEIIKYSELNSIPIKDIVINCTPLGMYPNTEQSPLGKKELSSFKVLVDLVYNPLETLFLKYGRENNSKTVNGLYMLVGQGVKAQEIWNETTIDSGILNGIYNEVLELVGR